MGLALVLGYIVVLAAFAIFQNRLLYRPTRYARTDFDRRVERLHLSPWPDSRNYRALLGLAPPDARPGTLLIVHGNAGSALGQAVLIEKLAPLGLQVLINEYPGFGARAGSPDAASLRADLGQTLRMARAERPGPLVVLAVSVGTGIVASAMVEQGLTMDALVLATPFASRREAWQRRFPYLPVSWLMSEDLDPGRDLAHHDLPVAVILAEEDRTTPPDQGRRVFDVLQGDKTLIEVKAAEHGDWIGRMTEAQWQELFSFLRTAIEGAGK